MPISTELQAKIDALEDEGLKVRILDILNSPGRKYATNEEIFESMMLGHAMVRQRKALLISWSNDDVERFSCFFCERDPEGFREFLRQERELDEIDLDLAWEARRLMNEWMPGLDHASRRELFVKFRDYAGLHSCGGDA